MAILATLGLFVFSPDTGSFEQLDQTWQFTWAKPDPIGSTPVKQWTGPGDQTISITGGIWPEIQPAGSWKIDVLAARAGLGLPMSLRLGNGRVLGLWCVEEVKKSNKEFVSRNPAEIQYSIKLSKFTGGGLWPF